MFFSALYVILFSESPPFFSDQGGFFPLIFGGLPLKSLKYLWPFLKKNLHKFILGILTVIFVDIIQLIPLKLIGDLTDRLVSGTVTIKTLLLYAIAILAITLVMAGGRFLWRILIIGSSRRMETWLRNRLFDHMLLLPSSFFDTQKTGNLMALCTNDIRSVRMAFGIGMVMMTDAIFMTLITGSAMALTIDKRLTLFAILPLPFIAVAVLFMGVTIKKRFFNVQKAFGSLTNKVQESFSGIRVTKSFAQELYDQDDFEKYNLKNYKAHMSLSKIDSALFPFVNLISAISLAIALAYGGHLVIEQTITLGALVTFISYLAKMTWPMTATGWLVNLTQRGLVSLSRIGAILDTDPAFCDAFPSEDDRLEKPTAQPKGIAFNNVSFFYPNTSTPALKNVSFFLPSGKTLGIVGRTGCGKSTIARLLLRLYEPSSGEILIGDKSILSYSVYTLRQMIGFVPQDTFLFSKSIRENITFAKDNLSDSKIEHFAKLAQFHEEVMSFSDGYETQLGERGINISGGQKQRLSIARGLAKSSPIVIFDDALSAVDTKTEKRLLEGLKEQTHKKTTIIISHRLSTIHHADYILVLDKGTVCESGTHFSLLNAGGLYSKIYEQQKFEMTLPLEDSHE